MQRVFCRVDPANYRIIAPKPVDLPIAGSATATNTHSSTVGSELSATLIGSSDPQLESSTATLTLKTLSRPAKRRRVAVLKPVEVSEKIIDDSRQLLIKDAQIKIDAAINFPPDLNDHTNYIAAQDFQSYIDQARASHQDVCVSCGLFIAVGSKHVLKKTDKLVQTAFKALLLTEQCLDGCGKCGKELNEELWFCTTCQLALAATQASKFRWYNQVNMTTCVQFLEQLKGLTLVEEALIARAHLVISILKLRPAGGSKPSATYQRIRGHAVVLQQNPGPLLHILPSSMFQPYQVIKVVWASDTPHTTSHLQQHLQVRKQKVQVALEWLHQHNSLYKDVVIDYAQLDQWKSEFIPTEILNNIVQCDNAHHEKEGYASDLAENNYENDFQVAIDLAESDQLPGVAQNTMNGCVYVDVENNRQHPTDRLITALQAEKYNDLDSAEAVPDSIITYRHQGQAQPLNDYEDSFFFTATFPTLFLFGNGGHLGELRNRKINVSLTTWAWWALLHHTRR